MAKQGKAGTALGIAAIGSFIGGTVSIIGLTFLAPSWPASPSTSARRSTRRSHCSASCWWPPSATAAKTKALIAAAIGLLLATVGRDIFTGESRFTFGNLELADGIDFVPIAMGLFGLGEILYNLEERHRAAKAPAKVANVWPSRKDLRQSSGAIGRGSVLGFVLGILPGGGATLASMAAYAMEKQRAKHPERFGKGAVEGVAGPETANNAAATSSFIPLLTLGIPANATMALMFGALLIQGVTPGPAAGGAGPRAVLGRRQLHVHRQHPAADHEHAAGRDVREDPPGPGRDPGPDHRPDHAARRLHHQQQHVRHRRW